MSTKPSEKIHIREAPEGSRCDVHDWPSDGLARRLVEAMAARYGTGGINACRPCIERAHADAHAKVNAKNKGH